jgi:hypothetical protein
MGIYDMKAECLKHLRNICDYKYPAHGNLATAFAALQKACSSRRWALESSMETEAGLEQWVSVLDAAWETFKEKSAPVRGRDGSVMPQHPDDNNLRAYVNTQITLCKVEAAKMQQYRKVEREGLRQPENDRDVTSVDHLGIHGLLCKLHALVV